jgi:hypothetical protein
VQNGTRAIGRVGKNQRESARWVGVGFRGVTPVSQLAVKGESDFCSDRQTKVPIVSFWFYFPVLGSIWMIRVLFG